MDPALQELLQASYDRGRLEGEKVLTEALIQQRHDLQQVMNGVLEALRQAVPEVIRDTENSMVTLTLEIAQKLVANLPISVTLVEAAVRDALSEVQGATQFVIRLHPADLELLQQSGASLLSESSEGQEMRFMSSPEVTRGGCLVHTRFGVIDARRETKYDLLKRQLTT